MSVTAEEAMTDAAPQTSSNAWDGVWPETTADFERLVEAFQHRLVRYAYRRIGDLHDAEDVAQDVFVRAYGIRSRRKKIRNVSAYLYRMASNRCSDLLRKRKYRAVSLDDGRVQEIPSRQASGPEVVAAGESSARIRAVLERLPRRQSEVIQLKVFGELTLSEIAETTGASLGTVKSRLRYGLEKLRKLAPREWEMSK